MLFIWSIRIFCAFIKSCNLMLNFSTSKTSFSTKLSYINIQNRILGTHLEDLKWLFGIELLEFGVWRRCTLSGDFQSTRCKTTMELSPFLRQAFSTGYKLILTFCLSLKSSWRVCHGNHNFSNLTQFHVAPQVVTFNNQGINYAKDLKCCNDWPGKFYMKEILTNIAFFGKYPNFRTKSIKTDARIFPGESVTAIEGFVVFK